MSLRGVLHIRLPTCGTHARRCDHVSIDVIATSLLVPIGIYGFTIGITGTLLPDIAARLGAELAGRTPYVSMASLGLFGFIAAGLLITVSFGTAPYTPASVGVLVGSAAFAMMFWLTGVSPALIYRAIARTRIRFDDGHWRKRRLGSIASILIGRQRPETHNEKIENTIATAGALGVVVTVINAVLAATLFDVEYESAGAVFAVVCSILVLTTVFAAGALQRFDAWK